MTYLLIRFPRLVRGMLFALGVIVMSGQPASSDPTKTRYVFVEDTDRWVRIERGKWQLIGKVDANGDFIHEYKYGRGNPTSLMPDEVTINHFPDAYLKPKKVYEFRSRMLIPGVMQKDGRFVPEEGGKIMKFSDYQYSPDAPPIWNLPGRFVTEEEAAKLKQAKPADKK